MDALHDCRLTWNEGASRNYGAAFIYCFEEADGTLWISNDEYTSQTNFCPVCGFEAKIKMKRNVESQPTSITPKPEVKQEELKANPFKGTLEEIINSCQPIKSCATAHGIPVLFKALELGDNATSYEVPLQIISKAKDLLKSNEETEKAKEV